MGMDKIGTSEWIRIRSSGHRLYLPLARDLITAFSLKKGDLLKVKVEEVQRAGERKRGDRHARA